MKKVLIIIFGLLALAASWGVIRAHPNWPRKVQEVNKEAASLPQEPANPVPSAPINVKAAITANLEAKAPTKPETVSSVLDANDLLIPFTSQAPSANWDTFHEEACEEASSLMVWHYLNQTSFGSADQVELELADAAAWERANLGTDVSVPAKDVVQMLRRHFGLDAALMDTVSEGAFKKALSAGHPIIVPAQGQFLKNPYFKQHGPRYHMLVIRGYDGSGRFITNDPGTKRGEKYPYSPEIIFNAIHDWNNGDVEKGAKIAIVVSVRSY